MLMVDSILIFITSFLTIYYFYRVRRNPRNLPPGPWGWPILGYLPHLGSKPHLTFVEMVKTYGSIFRVPMGSQEVVVLNGYKVIKEALADKGAKFAGRPTWKSTSVFSDGGTKGTIFSNGSVWTENRRFEVTALKRFGMGKRSIEEPIIEEVQHFLDALEVERGRPVDTSATIECALTNIIAQMTLGQRFEYGDEELKRILEMTHEDAELVGPNAAISFLPLLWYIPWFRNKSCKLQHNCAELVHFITKYIDKHIETFDPDNIRDVIDAGILKMIKEEKNGRPEAFGKKSLAYVISELFGAGFESTSTALKWCVLYMVKHPEVQTRVQKEIDSVVGRGCHVSYDDANQMPYTEATIMEVLRVANMAPLGLPHATTADVELNGYTIPEGTCIFANVWSVHMDPNIWQCPDKFNPLRFIGEDGKLMKSKAFMPYSLGRRRCVGEQLARHELFAFFASLLQRFSLRLPEGHPDPPTDGVPGLSIAPFPFQVIISDRRDDKAA
ncbi:cytochrome P450 18a1-like [Saccoglossus kowalevskii]|uniref:Cytochrome P450 18a1-like n=1 Tax=Saccoglossus kowalevskii TaxID=10224 RepID=A0ABM0GK66_SACKO|nr:PREDICTED: cytochrome P450 18a1-like [Saccoglossus kowalevskii]